MWRFMVRIPCWFKNGCIPGDELGANWFNCARCGLIIIIDGNDVVCGSSSKQYYLFRDNEFGAIKYQRRLDEASISARVP